MHLVSCLRASPAAPPTGPPRRFCRAGAKKMAQPRPQKPVFRRLGPKLVPADPGRTRRPGGRLGSRHKRKRRVGPPWRRPEGLFPPFLDAFPSHLSRSLAFLPPFSPFLPPNPLLLAFQSPPWRRRSMPCRARRQPRLAPRPSRSKGSRGHRHRSHRACRTPSGAWKFSGEKQSPPTGGTWR